MDKPFQYEIKIKEHYDWLFPPTRNRFGKARSEHDIKSLIFVESKDCFPEPTMICSDLHSHTLDVFKRLDNEIDLSLLNVICVGDMAGQGIYGSDGDPTEYYQFLFQKVKSLYIIQGNHDLPPKPFKKLTRMINNSDSTPAYLSDGKIYDTIHGKLGGVHGIISYKKHPYKKHPNLFLGYLEELDGVDILLTHDTPQYFENITGNYDLVKTVDKFKVKPKLWIYGHCHHWDFHNYCDGVNYLCVDGRVLIFNYPDCAKKEISPIMDNLKNLEHINHLNRHHNNNKNNHNKNNKSSQNTQTVQEVVLPSVVPRYANALKKSVAK